MDIKRCFKCLRDLPLSEFYRHAQMADGHLSKCGECTRTDVKRHRLANLEKVRDYDRGRAHEPHRKALHARVQREWKAAHPEAVRAERLAHRANLDRPSECEGCGRENIRIEKHHPSYLEPLFVVWLCKPCHAIADKIRRRMEAAS